MRLKAVSYLVLAAVLTSPVLTYAANFSDLKVVQEAAQTGMWTMVTTGTLTDGRTVPPRSETVCATKQEVIESFSNPFMWDTRTGEEDRDCPTVLTENTSTVGVATMSCKAITIAFPGQPLSIPATELSTEFKRTSRETWTIRTGNVLTNITYHGAATAGCVVNR